MRIYDEDAGWHSVCMSVGDFAENVTQYSEIELFVSRWFIV